MIRPFIFYRAFKTWEPGKLEGTLNLYASFYRPPEKTTKLTPLAR
jgi:hypothetical protein